MNSFGVNSGKRRVAHPSSASSIQLMRDLAFKRQSVSEMVEKLSSKAKKSVKKENRLFTSVKGKKAATSRPPARSRKVISSEEEDFDDDYDEQEGEESFSEELERDASDSSSFSPSDNASNDRIPSPNDFEDVDSKEKEHPDTEPSHTAPSVKWLCKPRLNGNNASIGSGKGPPPPVAAINRRKRAVISSSEESDDNDSEIRAPITLKMAVKRAKRHKDSSISTSEESEAFDSEGSVRMNGVGSDSDDSVIADRRTSKQIAASNAHRETCVKFFNSATLEKLLEAPRVTEKVAEFVITNRPFTDYEHLQSKLSECPRGSNVPELYVDYLQNLGIVEKIMQDCRRHSENMQSALEDLQKEEAQVQPELLAKSCTLHPYQQVGLNWLIMMHKLNINAILGDEMGLGKTIQVIAFLTYLKEKSVRGPHLIVVPSTTIENWMAELAKWSPSIKVLTYYGSMEDRRHLRAVATDKTIDVLLTTYNMIGSKAEDRNFFKRFKINYVIYDEGHLLKNCLTERYKNLMKISGERKILLTGTPLQNNLMELISLMFFTMTTLFTNYCDDISQLLQQFQQKIPAMDAKNGALYEDDKIEQAKAILRPFILRRLKANVLSCLPKKNDRIVKCTMIPEQREIYMDLVREFRMLDDAKEKANTGRLMQLRQISNHPLLYRRHYHDDRVIEIAKILCKKEEDYSKKNPDHVAEDLAFLSDFAISQLCSKYTSTQKYCLDEKVALESGKFKELDVLLPAIKNKGDKVLIFSQFTMMLDILEVYLRLRGHNYCRLDGSTPVMERQEMINSYNSSKDLFVFLLSTKAGGMGINLTAANHIILHDIDFNPYNDKQAEDRCHRMGQQKEVFVVRLISANSVEEGMLAVAQKKLELEKEVTGDSTANDIESDSQTVEHLLKKALALE